MKKTRAFALVETLIVSTIIATILMYIFIQFNKVEGMYDESFAYNDVDNLYKLDSIKGYIDSLDNSSVINITAKINSDDIIIMDRNEDTYSNIEYLDNQVDLLNNLDVKTLVFTKSDVNNVDTSNLSATLKNMIKKIDNKSNNYRMIAEFNNGDVATITMSLDDEIYDASGNEYILVNYLESTGTQYINTGYNFTGGIAEVDIKFSMTDVTPELWQVNYVCGSGNPSSPRNYFLGLGIINAQTTTYLRAVGGATIIDNGMVIDNAPAIGKIEDLKLTLNESTKKITSINNGNTSNFTYTGTAINSYNYILFGTSFGDTDIRSGKIILYNAKIIDNNNLIRDYIPVIDSSRKPCLFDKVRKECYYNQGTGEFLYG